MNPNLQAILSRLDTLSAKVGVAANGLWRGALLQQRIWGIENAVWTAIVAVGGWCLAKALYDQRNKWGNDHDFIVFLAVAALVLTAAIATGLLDCALQQLLNPSWSAFQTLMGR